MAPPEDAVAIAADPAKDEKKDEKKDKSKDVKDDDALSAEDEALKEGLELAVERLKDPDEGVQKMVPKKPSTDNRKVGALLGRELVAPETSVQLAFATLKPGGHL